MFVEIILSINPYYKIGEGAADCKNGSPLGTKLKKKEKERQKTVFLRKNWLSHPKTWQKLW
jgi:hypothetical protein